MKISFVLIFVFAVFPAFAQKDSSETKDFPLEIMILSYEQGSVAGGTRVYQNPNCVNPKGNMVAYCQAAGGDIHASTGSRKVISLRIQTGDYIYTAEGKTAFIPGKYNARLQQKGKNQEFWIASTGKNGKQEVSKFEVTGMERLPK
jgi:hypothetical protein